jgi:two-component system, OmpR family, KDP operon response regulator KdpE
MIAPQILIVDDEPQIRRLMEAAVTRGGYRALTASSGREAIHIAETHSPDGALIDLGLPDRDGIELVDRFARSGMAVIVVSARDATAEKIAALDLGAADYVVKPFDTDELLARLRAALRTKSTDSEQLDEVTFGDVVINLNARLIHRQGCEVRLAPKEYALLELLARNAGRVVTHAQLLKTVWGPAHENDVEYLRVAVRAIRRKLEVDPTKPLLVRNEPGVGYRLMVA